MRYLGAALILLAGWLFVRITAMEKAGNELARLARYRESAR